MTAPAESCRFPCSHWGGGWHLQGMIHPILKGLLETCGLIWRLSSFSAGSRGHLAGRQLGRCRVCGWLKSRQANPTRTFRVEMNIPKPRPCPKLCESAGLQSWGFWDEISATLLILYQSQCLRSSGEFSFLLRPCSAEGSRVFSPTHGHAHMHWVSVLLLEKLPLYQTDGKSGRLFLMLPNTRGSDK